VAGRHYLTKAEINALYFATFKMGRPRGWDGPFPVGRYWRSALVVFEPEIQRHARGHCSASNHGATDRAPFLPLPPGMPTSEEDWN